MGTENMVNKVCIGVDAVNTPSEWSPKKGDIVTFAAGEHEGSVGIIQNVKKGVAYGAILWYPDAVGIQTRDDVGRPSFEVPKSAVAMGVHGDLQKIMGPLTVFELMVSIPYLL